MSLSKAIKIIQKLNTTKLLESIHGLPKTVREESWKLTYDKLADALYLSPKIVPNDAVLFNINNELAVYINGRYEIKCLFIENFSANFIKHNKEFQELLEVLDKQIDNNMFTLSSQEKAQLYEKALEATLLEAVQSQNSLVGMLGK